MHGMDERSIYYKIFENIERAYPHDKNLIVNGTWLNVEFQEMCEVVLNTWKPTRVFIGSIVDPWCMTEWAEQKFAGIPITYFGNVDRPNTRFEFSNTDLFWRPIGPVKIKKIDRPLKGSEPVVWGIYWTLHVLGTIIAVVAVPDIQKIHYFVISCFVLAVSIKYRYNKIIVYLMASMVIIFVVFLWKYKPVKS